MTRGIAQVMSYAVGVAISLVPIIAIVLMLFTARARENASAFVVGWALTLAVVSGIACVVSDAAEAETETTASDTVSWSQIAFGVVFLLLAARAWRNRPSCRWSCSSSSRRRRLRGRLSTTSCAASARRSSSMR